MEAVAFPRHRWTVAEVLSMVESGGLGDDVRMELLGGELIDMAPQGPHHHYAVRALLNRITRALEEGQQVTAQAPLWCSEHDLPEPDLAIIEAPLGALVDRHPRADETLLVVEVAKTSQRVDLHKLDLYARAGVPEVWLVDLPAGTVRVAKDPVDGVWTEQRVYRSGDAIAVPGTELVLDVDLILG